MTERMRRWRPSNFTRPATAPLRIENALGTDGGTASLYIYDALDAWGGEWGVSASEFVAALTSIQASQIDLHLNSPGGDYREAVAMRAALVAHPATITVYVDGWAASAASIIATVGQRVVMAPGSQQMVHKASSMTWGNADQMREDAAYLDTIDEMIAGFYAQRAARGTTDEWLAVMAAETWYGPEEAVAAGLADEVAPFGGPARQDAPDEQLAPAAGAPDRWILAAYRYAGRENAPAPAALDTAPADEAPPADEPTETPDAMPAAPDAPPTAEPPTAAAFDPERLRSALREVTR